MRARTPPVALPFRYVPLNLMQGTCEGEGDTHMEVSVFVIHDDGGDRDSSDNDGSNNKNCRCGISRRSN